MPNTSQKEKSDLVPRVAEGAGLMGGYWRKMEEIREVNGCLDQKLIRNASQLRKTGNARRGEKLFEQRGRHTARRQDAGFESDRMFLNCLNIRSSGRKAVSRPLIRAFDPTKVGGRLASNEAEEDVSRTLSIKYATFKLDATRFRKTETQTKGRWVHET
jgi:hypothetical protein